MKNFTEIQAELHGIQELQQAVELRLQDLSAAIKAMQTEEKNVPQVDYQAIWRMATVKPIKSHKLQQADSYMKKLYLQMLAAVIQLDDQGREQKLVLLQRIAVGMSYEDSLENLLKGAMTADASHFDEFLQCVSDVAERQLFVFEALLLSNLTGEMNDRSKKYIAELVGYLGIENDEMLFLIKLAVCVLEQSVEKYQCLVSVVPASLDIRLFYDLYISGFYQGIVCDNEVLYYMDGLSIAAGKMRQTNKRRNVLLKNSRIDMKSSGLSFSGSSIVFENCDFVGGANCLLYKDAGNIAMLDCRFNDFSHGICVCEDNCRELLVDKCVIKNCGGENLKACFSVQDMQRFQIKASDFRNCFLIGSICISWFYSTAGVIADISKVKEFYVANTRFDHCNNYRNSSRNDAEKIDGKLFSFKDMPDTDKRGCFINCKATASSDLY